MYWIIGESVTKAVVIPFAVLGESTTFQATLVVEDGEVLNESYLFVVKPSQSSWLQLLLDTGDTLDIGCMFDPTCFLGTLTGPITQDLTFQLNLPITQSGESFITIALTYDSESSIRSSDCFSDDSTRKLWADDECEAPLWTVAEDRLPIVQVVEEINYPHNTYDRALPGVSLSKGNLVYLDTSGEERLLKLAKNDASFAEAAVVGIIDDESVNYQFREGAAVATDGTYVYWHGGIIDSVVVNTIARLDWSTKLWYAETAGGTARKEHTAVYYNGKLYFWGGVDSSGNFLNSLQSYDLTTKVWATLAAGGTARALHAAVLVGDQIHFIGGVNAEGVVLTVDIYDIGSVAWSEGTSASSAFSQLDIGLSPLRRPYWQVINGVLYYGDSAAGRNRKFYTYASGIWTTSAVMAAPSTYGRTTYPTSPIQPEGSLPQYCARILPFGVNGPAYWICIDSIDKGSGF